MPTYYWFGITIAYLGFILALAEVIFEPLLLVRPFQIQIGLLGIVLLFCTIFTLIFVIIEAPLDVSVMDFGPGAVDENGRIGDVLWKSEYHDVRVLIANKTDDDYTNASIWVRTDLNIAHVGRLGKCLDGYVEPAIKLGPAIVRGPNGEIVNQTTGEGPVHIAVPGMPGYSNVSFGSYSPIWKMHCEKIKSHEAVEFVVAVVHLDKQYFVLPAQTPKWVDVNVEFHGADQRTRKTKFHLPVISNEDFLRKTESDLK